MLHKIEKALLTACVHLNSVSILLSFQTDRQCGSLREGSTIANSKTTSESEGALYEQPRYYADAGGRHCLSRQTQRPTGVSKPMIGQRRENDIRVMLNTRSQIAFFFCRRPHYRFSVIHVAKRSEYIYIISISCHLHTVLLDSQHSAR